jgi:hypothetical protein
MKIQNSELAKLKDVFYSALSEEATEGPDGQKGHQLTFRLICSDCAPKPSPMFLALDPKWFVGRYVKLGFPIPGNEDLRKEHMWVRVNETTDKEGQELVGVLDNDPTATPDWKIGDVVAFRREEIEDVI